MAFFKCKMCGGTIEFEQGDLIGRCDSCGTRQTLPNLDDDKKIRLFERANKLRLGCEFDRAATVYEELINNFPEDPESYWGLILCKYGIEYVDDPATGHKIPTCHRSSYDSIMDDPDFEMVMENSEGDMRVIYRDEAKQIEEIRKDINRISEAEDPYDIFICYKESADDGQRTLDSVLAQDLYQDLTSQGYRVFFARISLEDKVGTEYEPYIFAALNSARIMLAVGTSYDYYNAVWVKNEWSRFLRLMGKDSSKHLIPCFKDIDAYDIPKEFRRFQAQDLGKVGARQDLLRGIRKLLGDEEKPKQVSAINADQLDELLRNRGLKTKETMLKRAFVSLGDRDFPTAEGLFEEVLSANLEDAEAYMGKLLVAYRCESVPKLAEVIVNELFPKKWITVRPSTSVAQLLKNNFRYFDRIDPISLSVLNNTHMKIFSRKEALDRYESGTDYVKAFFAKSEDSFAARRLYEHFLEYADEELRARYDLNAQVRQRLDEIVEGEERTLATVKQKCTSAQLTEVIKDLHNELTAQVSHQRENQKQQYEKNMQQINMLERQINSLSGFSNSGKRKELKEQVATLKKANDAIKDAEKRGGAKAGSVQDLERIGSRVRGILARKGYVEELPPIQSITLGCWKARKGDNVPIRWKVVGKEDRYLLLISEEVLDVSPFTNTYAKMTWKDSQVRKFLNGTFYEKAFTDSEKEIIEPVCMDAVGMNTQEKDMDHVTLLSAAEWQAYMPDLTRRGGNFSAYASNALGRKNDIFSWTRDGGRVDNKRYIYTVMDDNGIIKAVAEQIAVKGGVRPAIWLDIS